MKRLNLIHLLSLLNLLFPVVVQATGKRTCGLLSDTEYRIIWKRTIQGRYDVPVAERTLLERSTLRRYQRQKDHYSFKENPLRLFYKGKEILSESKCNRVIIDNYHKCKGIGIRRMYKLLERRYTGISENKISKVLSKLPEYQRKNARFPNKAPLKHVCSSSVHEIIQIDLVDMQREAVLYRGQNCKFILSVMDIFSRYVWLRALPSKCANAVTKHLRILFRHFGNPEVIQHDRGKEFDGHVKRLLKKLNIKNIKSRPYHPQSQGKVERMHKSLKEKIAYDLTHAGHCGFNWAKQLPEYQRILNNTPKECLAWSTPYEIYYGRDPNNKGSTLTHKTRVQKLRDAAKAATIICNKRKDKAYQKACKTPVYSIGDPVLLRYKKNGILNRRKWIINGKIIDRSLKSNMYKIRYIGPNSTKTGEKRWKAEWFHISNITRTVTDASSRKSHRQRFYIPMTNAYRLDNLRSEFGLAISFNPPGNGNCQYSAVSHQLHQFGIYRSEQTLRQDVVNFLRHNPELGRTGTHWSDAILESSHNYLSRMAMDYEYGDHITLQAISQMYYIQIVVVSTDNRHTTLISPNGSSDISDNIPLIILGHYPENAGEHYVALQFDRERLQKIIEDCTQISWEASDINQSDTDNSAPSDNEEPIDRDGSPSSDQDDSTSHCESDTSSNSADLRSHIAPSDNDEPTERDETLSSDQDDSTSHCESDTSSNSSDLRSHIAPSDNDESTERDETPLSDQDGSPSHCESDTSNNSSDLRSHIAPSDNNEPTERDETPSSYQDDSTSHCESGTSNNSSDLRSRIEKLREVIEMKRRPKRIEQHVELPLEIWFLIVNNVLKQDPSSRYVIERVNRLFRDIVRQTPLPRIYLAPDRFRNISVSPISVRRIISIAGCGSGLVQAIRNIITNSSWANAWLFLRLSTFCGWYTIDRIWYRRKKH